MQPSIYHQGLMVGETPNIDRIGDGRCEIHALFAEQSCTAGRTAFITGMHPLRTGMILPQLPGSLPTCDRAPRLSPNSCSISATTPASSARTISATIPTSLPTAHGFQEFWGYLYHLDAMQGVSFPDINRTPIQQTIAPPCKNTPIPGLPEVPGAVDPKTTLCLTPPRPVIRANPPTVRRRNRRVRTKVR